MKENENKGVSIHMGFPNPAADRTLLPLDLHKLLIKNPSATFFMRLEGNEWEDRGMFDGDILIIDRALDPGKTDLVIATKDDAFLITPMNKLPKESTLWGVVTTTIHQTRS